MKAYTSLAAALLCSTNVMAHFTLDYPVSRGFNDDAEPTDPCGGFDAVANRSQFPLTKGFLEIASHHPSAKIQINLVLSSNPTPADFTAAASSPASSMSLNHPGHACLPFDLSSSQGAVNNVNATIQVIYNGGDSPLYQCSDVVLVTTAPGFDQSKCLNDYGGSPSSSGTPPAPTSSGAVSTPIMATAMATALTALTVVLMSL